jgi:hypothetical protein
MLPSLGKLMHIPSIDLERMLLDLGALKESDIRLKKRSDDSDDDRAAKKQQPEVEDYDEDWD